MATPSCSNWENIQCRKQHQIWLQLRTRHQRASRMLHWQYPNLKTSLPLESTAPTITPQKLWRTHKREAQQITIDKWPQREKLEFKIASGHRKILTRSFKEPITTATRKAQSEKRSLTRIYDVFKISGDNEAILDFRDLSKSPIEERQRWGLRHKVWRIMVSNDKQTCGQQLGESVHDANWKVGRVQKCVAHLR